MDGTVDEGILLYKGQEKRKVWKMELYSINRRDLSKNVGNKGSYPFSFKCQRIRKALIFCFGRIFDQYIVFSNRPLLDNSFAISPVSHSKLQRCDLVATGRRPWNNFALHKLTGHLFVKWQKLKEKESVLRARKKINSLEYPRQKTVTG